VHKKASASSVIVVRRTKVQIGVSSQDVVTQLRVWSEPEDKE